MVQVFPPRPSFFFFFSGTFLSSRLRARFGPDLLDPASAGRDQRAPDLRSRLSCPFFFFFFFPLFRVLARDRPFRPLRLCPPGRRRAIRARLPPFFLFFFSPSASEEEAPRRRVRRDRVGRQKHLFCCPFLFFSSFYGSMLSSAYLRHQAHRPPPFHLSSFFLSFLHLQAAVVPRQLVARCIFSFFLLTGPRGRAQYRT